jgi:hypothetical protein
MVLGSALAIGIEPTPTDISDGLVEKHVPVMMNRPCCGCDAGDAGLIQPICSLPFINTDGLVEKHVPVMMERPCCGCDAGDAGVIQPSCSLPSINTDFITRTKTTGSRTQEKLGCETVTSDPRTVYITASTTIWTTRVTTLRRLERLTSFTTTTVTSTIRLTKTDLSISARTVTTEIFFTMPTFQLITKYTYVDTTSSTTLTAPTFVASVTETETIVANSFSRTTTTTTSTESTFLTESTDTVTVADFFTYVFTDATNVVVTEAPSSRTMTITLNVEYTESVPIKLIVLVTTTLYPVIAIPSVIVEQVTVAAVTSTFSVSDPNPVFFTQPTLATSVLIS